MAQEIVPSSSPALEEVKEQFAQWRQNRKGRESIPDELWQAAVRLTKEHSLNKIVKELNLSYSGFKERVVKAQKNDSPFVEFHLPTPANGATHWVLEMDRPNGARMRISCHNGSIPNLLEIGKAFWSSV
jgi:hypothetical protein